MSQITGPGGRMAGVKRVSRPVALGRDGLTRWTAAVMDAYTGGVFAAPAAPGSPAADQPLPREDAHR